MTEAPSGSPRDPSYDDRQAHAHTARDPHGPNPSGDPRPPGQGPRPPFDFERHPLSRAAWQAVLFAGVAALVLGILVLVWPGASLVAAGVLFGLYLVISGVLQLVSAFGTHRTTALRVLAFVSGTVSILLGLFCFRGATQSILLLGLWIGIGWVIRGITQTLAAFSDPTVPARGWQAFLGVLTFIAGIVLIDSPYASVAVLTILGGWWLVAVGIVEIVTAFRIRGRTQDGRSAAPTPSAPGRPAHT
ncbi:HdeD family acid-resistance protein [Streptomyces sp. NPDC090306]|uniref:HdeD family acid-resistance protein n=1 Tax=unclassified Streptomyces TaxID=2593676 RepID=UPI0036E71DFF